MSDKNKYLRITISDNAFTGHLELFDMILKVFQNAERTIVEDDIPTIRKFILEVWPKFIHLYYVADDPKHFDEYPSNDNLEKHISEHLKIEIIEGENFEDYENFEDILIPISIDEDDYVFVR